VSITAPTTAHGNAFKRWVVAGSPPVPTPVLNVTLTRDLVATAEYFLHTPGTLTEFGLGCPGSQRLPPHHTATGTPEIGLPVRYAVVAALPLTPCWLVLGASNTNFLGLRLPFDAAPIGAPGCLIHCSQDLVIGATTTSLGTASHTITYPNDAALVGSHVFTQFLALDTRANTIGLTTSNAVDTLIGGVQ
jgi:hypothetical protein